MVHFTSKTGNSYSHDPLGHISPQQDHPPDIQAQSEIVVLHRSHNNNCNETIAFTMRSVEHEVDTDVDNGFDDNHDNYDGNDHINYSDMAVPCYRSSSMGGPVVDDGEGLHKKPAPRSPQSVLDLDQLDTEGVAGKPTTTAAIGASTTTSAAGEKSCAAGGVATTTTASASCVSSPSSSSSSSSSNVKMYAGSSHSTRKYQQLLAMRPPVEGLPIDDDDGDGDAANDTTTYNDRHDSEEDEDSSASSFHDGKEDEEVEDDDDGEVITISPSLGSRQGKSTTTTTPAVNPAAATTAATTTKSVRMTSDPPASVRRSPSRTACSLSSSSQQSNNGDTSSSDCASARQRPQDVPRVEKSCMASEALKTTATTAPQPSTTATTTSSSSMIPRPRRTLAQHLERTSTTARATAHHPSNSDGRSLKSRQQQQQPQPQQQSPSVAKDSLSISSLHTSSMHSQVSLSEKLSTSQHIASLPVEGHDSDDNHSTMSAAATLRWNQLQQKRMELAEKRAALEQRLYNNAILSSSSLPFEDYKYATNPYPTDITSATAGATTTTRKYTDDPQPSQPLDPALASEVSGNEEEQAQQTKHKPFNDSTILRYYEHKRRAGRRRPRKGQLQEQQQQQQQNDQNSVATDDRSVDDGEISITEGLSKSAVLELYTLPAPDPPAVPMSNASLTAANANSTHADRVHNLTGGGKQGKNEVTTAASMDDSMEFNEIVESCIEERDSQRRQSQRELQEKMSHNASTTQTSEIQYNSDPEGCGATTTDDEERKKKRGFYPRLLFGGSGHNSSGSLSSASSSQGSKSSLGYIRDSFRALVVTPLQNTAGRRRRARELRRGGRRRHADTDTDASAAASHDRGNNKTSTSDEESASETNNNPSRSARGLTSTLMMSSSSVSLSQDFDPGSVTTWTEHQSHVSGSNRTLLATPNTASTGTKKKAIVPNSARSTLSWEVPETPTSPGSRSFFSLSMLASPALTVTSSISSKLSSSMASSGNGNQNKRRGGKRLVGAGANATSASTVAADPVRSLPFAPISPSSKLKTKVRMFPFGPMSLISSPGPSQATSSIPSTSSIATTLPSPQPRRKVLKKKQTPRIVKDYTYQPPGRKSRPFVWTGPIDEEGRPTDAGRIVYSRCNGQVYQGQVTQSATTPGLILRHGTGTCWWPDGEKYSGQWSYNSRHGHGTHTWPNGRTVTGSWFQGHLYGRGVCTWPNHQALYDGEYHRGKRHGHGKLTIFVSDEDLSQDGDDESETGLNEKSRSRETLATAISKLPKSAVTTSVKPPLPPGTTFVEDALKAPLQDEIESAFALKSSMSLLKLMETLTEGFERDMEKCKEKIGRSRLESADSMASEVSNKSSAPLLSNSSTPSTSMEEIHKERKGRYCVYDGWYKNGHEHGQGSLTAADGSRYRGSFAKGQRDGTGLQIWPGGQFYNGEWRNNTMAGHGTLTFRNGSTFTGGFVQGLYHGHGSWHDVTTGRKFVGEWEKGREEGYGEEYWPSRRETFAGNFSAGKRHGYGIATYSDGSRYAGGWKHGRRSGRGIHVTAEGVVSHCGLWHGDRPLTRTSATITEIQDDFKVNMNSSPGTKFEDGGLEPKSSHCVKASASLKPLGDMLVEEFDPEAAAKWIMMYTSSPTAKDTNSSFSAVEAGVLHVAYHRAALSDHRRSGRLKDDLPK